MIGGRNEEEEIEKVIEAGIEVEEEEIEKVIEAGIEVEEEEEEGEEDITRAMAEEDMAEEAIMADRNCNNAHVG
jgi:hypothetical protein